MMTEAEWMCTFMCPGPEIEEEETDDRADITTKPDKDTDTE